MAGHECDTCGKLSIGVACSGLGPVSFAYCQECATTGAEPVGMFEYTYDECGEDVAEHVKHLRTVIDGVYVTWAEYVERRKAVS